MTKAEKRALEAYDTDTPAPIRFAFRDGYEQAEKDTVERVCEWLKKNATYIHPRTGRETCMINLNALRESMEEE